MSAVLLQAVARHLQSLRNLCSYLGNWNVKSAIQKSQDILTAKEPISGLGPLSEPFFVACAADERKFRNATLDYFIDLFELSSNSLFPSFPLTEKCVNLTLHLSDTPSPEEHRKTCKAIVSMLCSPSATFFIHGNFLSRIFTFLLTLHDKIQEKQEREVVEMTVHECIRHLIGYYGRHSIVPELATAKSTALFLVRYMARNAVTISQVLPGIAGVQIQDADMVCLIRSFTAILEKREVGIATQQFACTGLTALLQTQFDFFSHEAFEIVLNRDIHVMLLALALDPADELAVRYGLLLLTIWKRFSHIYVRGLYEVLDKGLLHSLSSPSVEQVAKTYHVYRTLATEPQLFVDMLVNYDWDGSGCFRSLWELTMEKLVKHAYPEDSNQLMALETVMVIVHSLWKYLNQPFTDKDKVTVDTVIEAKKQKDVFLSGVSLFSAKPKAGIEYFREHGFIKRDSDVAEFLFRTPQLDPVAVGNYIGDENCQDVLKQYVELFDFKGRGFEDCFREFLTKFRIPGEAQMIDRVMEQFGAKYYADNPSAFRTADTVYVLSFSALMLHTDAHHPNLKSRMTLEQFITNNKGIDGGKDLPRAFLVGLYEGITSKRIYATSSQSSQDSLLTRQQRAELYLQKCEQILHEAKQLSLENNCKFNRVQSPDVIGPLFKVIWRGVLAVFTISFNASDDPVIIKTCLDGMAYCSHIASHCYVEEALLTLVNSFSRFTRLRTYSREEVKPKNIECTRTLLRVAASDRNFLRGVWEIVTDEVSAVDKTKYFTVPDILFTGSASLDRESIKDFVKSMCDTSRSELKEDPPRTYMLLKLADVAYFNMDRPKFIWKEIWEVMSEFIIEVGSNETKNDKVLQGAVNVLWQIARKFIAKPETNAFHFQEHFLRPFFEIFIAQPDVSIKVFIIECCGCLVKDFSGSLHSGWNVIFQILVQASTDLRTPGFELLRNIIEHHFESLTNPQVIYLISVVLSFVVKGAADVELSCLACHSFFDICRQLDTKEANEEPLECVYGGLEQAARTGSIELKKKVLETAVEIATKCKMGAVSRENVKTKYVPNILSLCTEPDLSSFVQEISEKITLL